MPRAKKKTTTRKKRTTKKNVQGNWRGAEDRFFTKVRNGWKKIFSPAKWNENFTNRFNHNRFNIGTLKYVINRT